VRQIARIKYAICVRGIVELCFVNLKCITLQLISSASNSLIFCIVYGDMYISQLIRYVRIHLCVRALHKAMQTGWWCRVLMNLD
jgi:hypothetical protein